MMNRFLGLILLGCLWWVVATGAQARSAGDLTQSALAFRENRGQVVDSRGQLRPDVLYTAELNGVRLYFQSNRLSYVFPQFDAAKKGLTGLYRMDLELIGSNPQARVTPQAQDPKAGVAHYYRPHIPNGVTNVPAFERIVYQNVYDNIDLVFYRADEQGASRLKYDFVVRPGGKVSDIRFRYVAGESANLQGDGSLRVVNPAGELVEQAPVSFLTSAYAPGEKGAAVKSRYQRNADGTFGFAVDAPAGKQTLVIDPLQLVWSSYYGGRSSDEITSMTLDRNGNPVYTGSTVSDNFPVSPGAQQGAIASINPDAIAMKFNADGTRQWATYYGGTDDEAGMGVAVDQTTGSVAITGSTGKGLGVVVGDFPVTNGQPFGGGTYDAFVLYLNSTGTRSWATMYGGALSGLGVKQGADNGQGIAIAPGGDLYVTGNTHSTDFPTVEAPGAYFQQIKGGGFDMFLLQLSNTGNVRWATYIGGANDDIGYEIDIDGSSNIALAGVTGGGFPVRNAFQPVCNACTDNNTDGLLAYFNSSRSLQWASYIGGNQPDVAWGVSFTPQGSIFVTGEAGSGLATTGVPSPANGFQQTFGGGSSDGFLTHVTAAGTVAWSTYIGGQGTDAAYDVQTTTDGDAIVIGSSNSPDLPTRFPLYSTRAGSSDMFLTKIFRQNGTRQYATYYGGTQNDFARALAVDASESVFFAGFTTSNNIPLQAPTFQNLNNGSNEGVIGRIRCNRLPVGIDETGFNRVCLNSGRVELRGTPAGGVFSGTGVTQEGNQYFFTPSFAGQFTVTYSFDDGCPVTTSAQLTVIDAPRPTIGNLPPNSRVCVNGSPFTLTGTPVGGTFSGQGIAANGTFTPSTAGGPGVKTITYEVTDANGCTVRATVDITVDPAPQPTISGLNSPYCSNQNTPVCLTLNPPGGTLSINSPTGGMSGNCFTPSVAGAGSWIITYNVVSAQGCAGSTTANVEVTQAVQATVSVGTGQTQFCRTDQTLYPINITPSIPGLVITSVTGPGTGGTAPNYVFRPSDVPAGQTQSVINVTGTYGGCTLNASVTVSIGTRPTVSFSFNPVGPYCVTQSTPVTISTFPSGLTLSGPGVNGNQFTPSQATAGLVPICARGTVAGCQIDTCVNVTVTAPPTASIAVSPQAATYCNSPGQTLTLTGTPAGGTFSASRGFVSPTGPGVGTFSTSGLTAGAVTITYSGTSNGCQFTTNTTINIVDPINTTITGVTPNQNFCVTDNNEYPLTSNPAGATFSGPGVQNNFFNPTRAGVGTHTLTGTPGAGVCARSATVTVVVTAQPQAAITGNNSPYCVTSAPFTLTGSPAGGTFAGANNGVFTPSTPGTFPVTYSGSVGGCQFSATTQIEVTAPVQATIDVTPGQPTYCNLNGSSITITGAPTGGTLRINPGGQAGNPISFNPNGQQRGTYTITYTGRQGGCDYTQTRSIEVVDPVQTTVTVNGQAPGQLFCVTDQNAYALASNPAGATFSGPGVDSPTSLFRPSVAGVGTHTITVTPAQGVCARPTTFTVTVSQQPTASIIGLAGPYCISQSTPVNLSGSPAGGTFTLNGQPIGNLFTPSSVGAPGTYEIAYEGTVQGCSFRTTAQVTVSPVVQPTLSLQPDQQTYCNLNPQPIQLTATPTNGTFRSSTGFVSPTGPGTGTFTPNLPAGSVLIDYFGNQGGCAYTISRTINIVDPVQTTVTGQPAGAICVDDTRTFTLTSNPAGAEFTYNGGPIAGNTISAAFFGARAGTYTIQVNPGAGVCARPTSITVTITDKPTVQILNVGGPYCVTQTTPVNLVGVPTPNTFSGPGVSGNAQTGFVFTPSVAGVGVHTIICNVVQGACTAEGSVQVTVNAVPQVQLSVQPDLGTYCTLTTTPVVITTLGQTPTNGTYRASIGNINNFGGGRAEYFLTQAGTATITYEGNQGGCNYSGTRTLQIQAPVQTTITGQPTGPICSDDQTRYSFSSTPAGATYTLNGNPITSFAAADVNRQPGSYTITATPAQGACALPTSFTIVITARPEAQILNAGGPYCVGSSPVQLIGVPSGGTFSGSANVSASGLFTPSTAGTSTITYSGTQGVCSFSATVQITVTAQPTVQINASPAAGPNGYCSITNQTVDLTATINGGQATVGVFTGTNVNNLGNGRGTFNPQGLPAANYDIIFSGNFNGCQFSQTLTVRVQAPVPTNLVNFNAGPYCENDNNAYNLTSEPAGASFRVNGNPTSVFVPAQVGVGVHTITWDAPTGVCALGGSTTVVVSARPQAQIVGLAGPYCQTQTTPVLLQGVPTGGTFSGPGVSGNQFVPANAGTTGSVTIRYSGTLNGCAFETTAQVQITATPTVTVQASNPGPFCTTSTEVVQLFGTPAGGSFSGPGVSNEGNGFVFRPLNLPAGTVTVRYTGNFQGCEFDSGNQLQFRITAPPAAQLLFSAEPPFCSSQTSVTLTGTPNGGTFSGIGVTGNVFNPSQAPTNTPVAITYSGNFEGCQYTVSRDVIVTPQPTNVAIIGEINGGPFCQDRTDAIALQGSPAGGSFTFNGQPIGNSLRPADYQPGTYTLRYFGRINGCDYETSIPVRISTAPQIQIAIGTPPPYCPQNNQQIPLIGFPAGGTFSGPGVVDGRFFVPANAGSGTHEICYQGVADGCSYRQCTTVTVNPPPPVDIIDLAASYCIEDRTVYTIRATLPGGVFTGPSVQPSTGPEMNRFGYATIIPRNMTPFPRTVEICYFGVYEGCPFFICENTEVEGAEPARISGLEQTYCVNENQSFPLSAVPSGGVFEGPGIVGNTFNPSIAGIGLHRIIYSLPTGAVCAQPETTFVQVIAAPTLTVVTLPGEIRASATGGDGFYQFSINGGTFSSNANFPVNPGTHVVVVRDGRGCSDTRTVTVGAAVCDCPTGIRANNITLTSATVLWNANAAATAYEIRIRRQGEPVFGAPIRVTGTSNDFTGLQPSTTYDVEVRSLCANNQTSAYCAGQFTTIDCKSPDFLSSFNVGSTTADFRWDNVRGSAGYEFQYQVSGTNQWIPAQPIIKAANDTTHSLSDLTPNTDYIARVRTICVAPDQFSPYVFEFFTTLEETGIVCITPTNPQARVITGTRDVEFTWNEVPNVVTYEVQFRELPNGQFGEIFTVNDPNTSYRRENLNCPSSYEFRVRALCITGDRSAYTTPVRVDLTGCGEPIVCITPTNPQARVITGTRDVEFTWNEVPNVVTYEVQFRELPNGQFGEIFTVNDPNTSYRRENLSCPSSYEFRVRALCINGDRSAYTTPVRVDLTGCGEPIVCITPTNPQARVITGTRDVEFTWNEVPNVVTYEVQFRQLPNGQFGEVFAVNDPNTSYRRENLDCPASYEFRVRALCINGDRSAYTTAVQVDLTVCGPVGCPAPTNPRTLEASLTSATVAWTPAPTPPAVSQRLRWKLQTESTFPVNNVRTLAAGDGEESFTGLIPETTYDYEVVTICADGESAPMPGRFRTVDCKAPDFFEARNVTQTRGLLTWDEVRGSLGYEIQIKFLNEGEYTTTRRIDDGTVTQDPMTNLIPDRQYEARIRAICFEATQFSPWVYTTFTTLSCTAVPAADASVVRSTSAEITWDRAPEAIGYIVEYRELGAPEYEMGGTTLETRFNIDGLSNCTSYEVSIRAICEEGGATSPRIVVFTTTDCAILCSEVVNLQVDVQSVTSSSVRVTWSASPGPEVVSYNVQWKVDAPNQQWTPELPAADVGNVTSTVINGLLPNTDYLIRVRTLCGSGNGYSNPDSVSVRTDVETVTCPAPTNLRVTDITVPNATASWNAVAQAVNGYTVEWAIQGSGNFSSVNVVGTSTPITGLVADQLYEIRVRSNCANGETSTFTSSTFNTGANPRCATPTILSVVTTPTSARVKWSVTGNAVSYRVRWRVVGASTFSGDSTVGGAQDSLDIFGLTANTAYEIVVRAICSVEDGESTDSQPRQFVTQVVCATPVNFQVSTVEETSATIAWTVPVAASRFVIQLRTESATDFVTIDTVDAPTALYTLDALNTCTGYVVRVRSICVGGAASLWVTRTFGTGGCTCEPPATFFVQPTAVTCSTAVLNWLGVQGATDYEVQYKLVADNQWSQPMETTGNMLSIEGLESNSDYEARIRTVCFGSTMSDYTTTNFRTPSCVPGEGSLWQVVTGGEGWDEGHSVAYTADGGYVVTGYTYSSGAGEWDVYMAKFNAFGGKIWDRTFGGPLRDEGRSVIETSDRGYLLVGYTASFGAGESDVYVIKTNANGDILWQRTYGDAQWNVGYDVAETTDGGFVITGTSTTVGANGRDLYLLRIDAVGNIAWQQVFGASGDDYGYSVVQTRDGGYAAAGYSSGMGAGRQDILIVKTTADGQLEWANTYGGADRDFGYSIDEAPNGDLVVGGYTRSFGDLSGDGYLVKVDASGNYLWSRTYGTTSFDFANGVAALNDGSTVLTGGVSTNATDATIVKISATGQLEFANAYGGDRTDQGRDVILSGDGGFVIAGQSNTIFDDSRNADVYLIKTDPQGNCSGCNEQGYPATLNSPVTMTNDVRNRITPRVISTQPGNPNTSFGTPEYLTLQLCSDVVCPTVMNLTVERVMGTMATISWTTNGAADSYTIQYKRVTDANWSLSIRTDVPTYTLNGLFTNTDYEVQVRANCVDGSSTSDFVQTTFRTRQTDDACARPNNVTVTAITPTTATVNWQAVQTAVNYLVSYRQTSSSTWIRVIVSGASEQYRINGLTAATDYVVQVQSICGVGDSSTASVNVPFRTLTPREDLQAETPVSDLRLYPNPTQGPAQLSFDAAQGGEGTLTIVSLTGRTIYSTRLQVSSGYNEWPIDLSQETAGLYLIRFQLNGFEHTMKLLVQ